MEGILVQLYLYSNTLACPEGKHHLVFTFWLDDRHVWEETSGCQWCDQLTVLVSGLLWLPAVPFPGCSRLAARPVLLLLTSTCRHTRLRLTGDPQIHTAWRVHWEQKQQLLENSSATWKLPRQWFSRGRGRNELSCWDVSILRVGTGRVHGFSSKLCYGACWEGHLLFSYHSSRVLLSCSRHYLRHGMANTRHPYVGDIFKAFKQYRRTRFSESHCCLCFCYIKTFENPCSYL